jgi:hypothetical protein
MQSLEPIQFTDFVIANGGNVGLAKDVPSSFYNSPSVRYFPKSEYRRKEFEKSPASGAVDAIFQHVIHPVSIDTGRYSPETYNSMTKAYGFSLAEQKEECQLKLFWFERAATFQFCPYGSCAWRASYAALQLFRVFQSTNIRVILKSAEKKDQFIVLVGNGKCGWAVYDALTNPDVFFPIELYNKKIVGTFADRRSTARQFRLEITRELEAEYTAASPRIHKLYASYCQKANVTVESLKEDPAYVEGLFRNGVKLCEVDAVTSKAINIFNELRKE